MNKILITLLISMGLSACAPVPMNQTPRPLPPAPILPPPLPVLPHSPAPPVSSLQEISLNTELPQPYNQQLNSWLYAFTAATQIDARGQVNSVSQNRVASFSSAQALGQDIFRGIGRMNNDINLNVPGNRVIPPAAQRSIADIAARNAASQVDFSRYDLIIVSLSSGSDGVYRITPTVNGELEFCQDNQGGPGVVNLMLVTTQKFYAAPKGTRVRMCDRR